MPTVNLRGLTFDYVDEGDAGAPACLLLHGFPQDQTSWDEISAGLMAAGYRVVRFDQRGYSPGARPGPVRAYRLAEPVSDAVALLDHLGLDTVHVVGHDWGGAVAWGIAAQHPERVQTLTVLSTPHPAALARAMFTSAQGLKSWYMGLFQVPGLAERLLAPGSRSWKGLTRGLPASHRDHYAERAREPGALPAMLNWYRAMPSDMRSPSVRWRRITPSTLYVWGADDPALGRTAARLTGDWISGPYTFVELPGEGHWLPERCAPKVLAVLLPLLGEV
ncbi:MAG: alpha/beta fold hydrolase [Actinomycetales bacterium]|nr:alpha/beta fold hydrolase [Actinomycetales bacterium]